MMLPMQINRRSVENYANIVAKSVSERDKTIYWDQELHEPLKKIIHHKTNEWNKEDMDKAVIYFRQLPFFKRLQVSTSKFKEIILNLHVVEKKYSDIIFDSEEDLYIVINGRVLLRLHDQDPLNYTNAAQYTSGMVIGHPSLDNGLSSLGQSFAMVASTECDLVRCNKQYFHSNIWKATLNPEMEVQLN